MRRPTVQPGGPVRFRGWMVLVALGMVASACVPPAPPGTEGMAGAPDVTPTILPNGTLQIRGIRYGTASGLQFLDLYRPGSGGNFPVVVWFHGGYWTQGNRGELPGRFRDDLLAAGYAVVTVDYRLAQVGANQWPTGLLDAKRAVTYLKHYAGLLDLDPERVVTSGFSAGGHLAVMVAISRDAAGVSLPGGDPVVRGAFAFGAPVDIPLNVASNPLASFAVGVVMGCASGNPCDSTPMQPPRYLDPLDPPVRLMFGSSDTVVPAAHGNAMQAAAAGVRYTGLSTETLDRLNHDSVNAAAPSSSFLPWLAGVM